MHAVAPSRIRSLQARYRSELLEPTADHLHAEGDRKPPYRKHPGLAKALDTFPAAEIPETRGRTWIWADLHFAHAPVIGYSNRPFANVTAMDEHLFAAWREAVRPDDLLIVVGDVALSGGLTETNFERIRTIPGRKILVIGNHDLTGSGRLRVDGFDAVYSMLYRAGNPNLLLTHVPIPDLPDGWVNVHGHWHEKNSHGRHINVSVEQLDYAPVLFSRVEQLAEASVSEPSQFEGATQARLEALEAQAALKAAEWGASG